MRAADDRFDVGEGARQTEALHDSQWALAEEAGKQDAGSITAGLFIQALNEVIDLHLKRVTVSIRNRVPTPIWATLHLLKFVRMLMMGTQIGLGGTSSSPAAEPTQHTREATMKPKHLATLGAALVCALLSTYGCAQKAPLSKTTATEGAQAQQVPLPKTAADVPGPAAGTMMTKEYVQSVGRMAYVWGYAMVNSHNRRAAFAYVTGQNGNVPGWNGGVLPMAPVGQLSMLNDYIKPEQTFVACPNQDVVYGAGFAALDQEPVVFQVPDFGDRFWVYALYDARTDEFARIGKPYGTKPGFYLMVGPNWKGDVPAGINAVVRSSTELVFSVPRVFKDDTAEDTRVVQALLNQIGFYPLSKFDGKMKTTDWSKSPHFPAPPGAAGETKWVVPEKFYDQLPGVMKLVPPLPGEEALYSWINSVFDAAAKDPATKEALIASFVAADKELIAPLTLWKLNGRSAGNGWTSPVNNAKWGSDYLNRTGTSKSNMYDNTPEETKYIYRDFDSQGGQLRGTNLYTVTFPKGQEPPVRGFWSMTLYNEHHLFNPNALNRYSLGTKSKSLQYNSDSSLTLYFGATSPGKGKETNWVPAPNGTFSLYIRAYWADKAILDGTWIPPQVEKVK